MYESCLYTSQAPGRCHYEEFHAAVLVPGLIIHNAKGISNMRTCVSETYTYLCNICHAYLCLLHMRTYVG